MPANFLWSWRAVRPGSRLTGPVLGFRFANGIRLIVFNDCGEWDYIDSYIAPDGTRIEADWYEAPLLLNWEPKHFARWGITTGYLNEPIPEDQL